MIAVTAESGSFPKETGEAAHFWEQGHQVWCRPMSLVEGFKKIRRMNAT